MTGIEETELATVKRKVYHRIRTSVSLYTNDRLLWKNINAVMCPLSRGALRILLSWDDEEFNDFVLYHWTVLTRQEYP